MVPGLDNQHLHSSAQQGWIGSSCQFVTPVPTAQLRMAVGDRPGEIARLAKTREFLWRLAKEYEAMGCLAHAEAQLRELLSLRLASHDQRLEALCYLADVQVQVPETCLRRLAAPHFRQTAQQRLSV